MRSPRLWIAMCVMTVCSRLGTSSRYGCLFEKRLCSRDQLCSDDGLFGQCLASQQELVHYQVSVPVLHRLQEVLKELMVQGLTWKDDITQYIISQELKDVPLSRPSLKPGSSSPQKLSERSKSSPNLQRLGPRLPPQPNRGQHYLDYTIVEPPQSPLHLQSLDPYTYQQKYSYQDDQERSLNSVDGGQYPRPSSQSGASRGGAPRPQDLDRQVLQDLVSLYLSPPAPATSRHRVAAPLSSSSFFPLDYTEDYISQDLEVSKQQQQQLDRKAPQGYDPPGEVDDDSLQRISSLLQSYGISLKDLTPDQLESLLQTDSVDADTHTQQDTQGENPDEPSPKKVMKLTEGSMTHVVEKASAPKPAAPKPPSAPGPRVPQDDAKVTTPPPISTTTAGTPGAPHGKMAAGAPQGNKMAAGAPHGKMAAVAPQGNKMAAVAPGDEGPNHFREEYGYIVTNQSHLSLYDGVHLLETLARRIHLTTSTFINIRYYAQRQTGTSRETDRQVQQVRQVRPETDRYAQRQTGTPRETDKQVQQVRQVRPETDRYAQRQTGTHRDRQVRPETDRYAQRQRRPETGTSRERQVRPDTEPLIAARSKVQSAFGTDLIYLDQERHPRHRS